MILDLHRPTWAQHVPDIDMDTVVSPLRGSWAEAATLYAADRSAKLGAGKRPPIGVQPHLNKVLSERYREAGWDGHGQRFLKEGVWLRVTFRHQMSIGSDILDALKVLAKGHAQVAIIAAATTEFVRVISPNDVNVLTSFEKLVAEVRDLDGAVSAPVLIGRLRPLSNLPPATASVVHGHRPREG